MRRFPILLFALFALSFTVQAEVKDVYDFDTRAEEQRYQNLIAELRCPKCQNNNIADSNSAISQDMRDEVYRMMKNGASNEEIVDALVSRFGEFVQYKPPVDRRTILLWAFPAIAVIGGFLVVVGVVMRSRQREQQGETLSQEDKRKAERILAGESDESAKG
ncbi:cytochrome c-type biogenesis protein [Marinobacter persicus]|jgi:cytochrome c-type biogenesis protein CcmH|uniref:Cytochrome c-type biogenesis protein n=1 Tax=Marinobacter persicus TaxID=930118 RepID=A0A2S6G761_9GAMM|nr:cytochrome c-type biogenesis protein [Marinobacter persicus]PPK51959.1 cytochrome c-type biogenesis protein CcmH [Marinobacter persicus]PPK54995.1 cytochrome c-type biogenesis protein CcmH [Marinobacter persicus]PPK58356.1 cytochrome c-type biogenesis protein CcmH [Marinobacter persicus]